MSEFELGGVTVRDMSYDDVLNWLVDQRGEQVGQDVHFVNAYNFALADADGEYGRTLRESSLNLADGKSVSIASRFLSRPVRQVRGPSLFKYALDGGRAAGLRHFFLGGTEETLQGLKSAAQTYWPGVEIVGTYSPPFADLSDDEIAHQASMIRESNADVVWLGLGTPKQDFAARMLIGSVQLPIVCVGAAFDFVAGSSLEAPAFVQKVGAEWLFRLVSEPKRLWRRYLLGNPRFALIVLKQWRSQ